MGLDTNAFAKYRDKLASQLSDKEIDKFADSLVKGVSARLIDLAKKNTPVRTGYLRRGFTGNKEISGLAFMAGEKVLHKGGAYQYTIINPVEYAMYVEYGHRAKGGKVVKGKHMLRIAEDQTRKEIDSYIAKKVEKKLKGAMK